MNEIDSSKEKLVSAYGHELILDLHGCNPETFTRDHLDRYFTELCDLIDMEKCQVHFWDDVGVPPGERQTSPKTKGTSAGMLHPHQHHRRPHPRRPWGGLCEHLFLQGIRPRGGGEVYRGMVRGRSVQTHVHKAHVTDYGGARKRRSDFRCSINAEET